MEFLGKAGVAAKPRGRKKMAFVEVTSERPSRTSLCKGGPSPQTFVHLLPFICFIQDADHKS